MKVVALCTNKNVPDCHYIIPTRGGGVVNFVFLDILAKAVRVPPWRAEIQITILG